ncbi:MAG TPA: hypothetical protein VK842_09485 [bacterium]|nr:hypothetical protein [bacterium]
MDTIAALAEMKRVQYESYQPVFHRRAVHALADHRAYLRTLLGKEGTLLLVAEQHGRVTGFIFAAVVSAPSVYDPQGGICFIDDFMVEDPSLWPTTGRALAQDAFDGARSLGAVLANVVCGPRDAPKRALLGTLGFEVGSEWHLRPLDEINKG